MVVENEPTRKCYNVGLVWFIRLNVDMFGGQYIDQMVTLGSACFAPCAPCESMKPFVIACFLTEWPSQSPKQNILGFNYNQSFLDTSTCSD